MQVVAWSNSHNVAYCHHFDLSITLALHARGHLMFVSDLYTIIGNAYVETSYFASSQAFGVPLISGKLTEKDCQPVMDRMLQRLVVGLQRFLSLPDRLLLLVPCACASLKGLSKE